MTDWSAIDAGLGRDTQPDDDPDRVVAAPDGGAGGWEAFDDHDALKPAPPLRTIPNPT
jgi:hypothetical protein